MDIKIKRIVAILLAILFLASGSTVAVSAEETTETTEFPNIVAKPTVKAVSADCLYGPDTCKAPYVWRDAAPNDHVCVLWDIRQQTANENALADQRRSPTGGIYGPNTCIAPYVWREAFPGDVVCVPVTSRTQAAEDNRAAASRRACV